MKYTITTLATLALLQACTPDDPKVSEPYRQLEEDQQRTQAIVAEKDSTINALFGTFNRISENLRTVRAKQGDLVAPSGGVESKAEMEQRIMADIEQIDALLAENKGSIAQLKKQARSSGTKLGELERMITDLEKASAEKDAEIGVLKEQLASTNSSLATLIERGAVQRRWCGRDRRGEQVEYRNTPSRSFHGDRHHQHLGDPHRRNEGEAGHLASRRFVSLGGWRG
ncbi:MAG: hypothetical protein IPN30_04845 [Flavobacteriales bacterium]|nr:hypothetical protein [Flavobacteriales bacterium]